MTLVSLLRFVSHVIFPEQMISFVTWSRGRRCADTTLYRSIRLSVRNEYRPVRDTWNKSSAYTL